MAALRWPLAAGSSRDGDGARGDGGRAGCGSGAQGGARSTAGYRRRDPSSLECRAGSAQSQRCGGLAEWAESQLAALARPLLKIAFVSRRLSRTPAFDVGQRSMQHPARQPCFARPFAHHRRCRPGEQQEPQDPRWTALAPVDSVRAAHLLCCQARAWSSHRCTVHCSRRVCRGCHGPAGLQAQSLPRLVGPTCGRAVWASARQRGRHAGWRCRSLCGCAGPCPRAMNSFSGGVVRPPPLAPPHAAFDGGV
jgi:hypothetical protein